MTTPPIPLPEETQLTPENLWLAAEPIFNERHGAQPMPSEKRIFHSKFIINSTTATEQGEHAETTEQGGTGLGNCGVVED